MPQAKLHALSALPAPINQLLARPLATNAPLVTTAVWERRRSCLALVVRTQVRYASRVMSNASAVHQATFALPAPLHPRRALLAPLPHRCLEVKKLAVGKLAVGKASVGTLAVETLAVETLAVERMAAVCMAAVTQAADGLRICLCC